MKRAYAAAVMVVGGVLAPVALSQAAPNDIASGMSTDSAQDNQDNSDSTSHKVPPFDPGYWTPDRMRDAQPAPMPVEAIDLSRISQQAGPIRINDDGDRVSDCCVSHTVPPFDPGYWTPERIRNAEPAPMPHPSKEQERQESIDIDLPIGQNPDGTVTVPPREGIRIPEDEPAPATM